MVSLTRTVTEFTSVQVHADHLCFPEAHLGNWPVPPPNAILAPPFYSTCQLAKLGSRRRSSTGQTDDEKQSSSGPVVGSEEPLKVRRFAKRRTKVTQRPAESSDDEGEDPKQERRQRRRKVLVRRGNPVPPQTSCDDEEEEESRKQQKRRRKVLLVRVTTSDCEEEAAISGEINISSEWKTIKSFKEKTKSAATPCGVEAAVPPAPTLTSSDSEDEDAISGEIDISSEWKTNKSFAEEKIKSASTPCEVPSLTESSADEEEAEVNTAEFRGGAGGSSNPVWRQLAERIMVGVRRARLPLRLPLDDITEGDGNCYFRALCSQLQRPEVAAPDHIRQLDHRSLRNKICNFMLKSKLPVVKTTKQNWLDFQDSELGEYNRYWADMRDSKGDIWAEGPVIHATTWFLERDIYLVSEKASEAEPFIAFSGNQDGTNASCAGAALWLGHLTGLHYQTLMPVPTEREMMPPRPELRKVEDTLKARAKAGEGTRMKQGAQVNFFKIRVHI